MLRFGVFGYWANSYWGGNVAAIGGALVLGALPRIKSALRGQTATVMGIGLALLANSRPWEGLVLSVPVALMLLWWMFGKNRPALVPALRRVALPLVTLLVLTGGWLAYYCWRTTNSPVRTPYQVYEQAYTSVPVMFWQRPRAQVFYRHPILAKLETDQDSILYSSFFTLSGQLFRVYSAAAFFFGPTLLLPFLVLPFALPKDFSLPNFSTRSRDLLILACVFAAGSEASVFYNPHYSAPATGLIIALILMAIRRIRIWNTRGLFLSRAIPAACCILFTFRLLIAPLHVPVDHASTYYRFQFFQYEPRDWFPRAKIERQLESIPGDHLVIVRYKPEHQPFPDWVYNRADIDHSRVIWARDMNFNNLELINHDTDRLVWLLEPDMTPPRLVRYAPSN